MGAIEIDDFSPEAGASGDRDAKGKRATPSGLVSLVRLTTWVGEVVLTLLLRPLIG